MHETRPPSPAPHPFDGAVYDVAVIGGGVVGCAVLRELSRYDLRICLLEKESDLAEGISKGNSGVIHAGFNVPPGSLKARLNVEGLGLIYDLAAALGVPHRPTGKLVVALSDERLSAARGALAQGDRNGVPGLEIVDRAAIERLAPGVRGLRALLSARTGIISPYELTIALAESAAANGAARGPGRAGDVGRLPAGRIPSDDAARRRDRAPGGQRGRAVRRRSRRPGRDRRLPRLSLPRRVSDRRQGGGSGAVACPSIRSRRGTIPTWASISRRLWRETSCSARARRRSATSATPPRPGPSWTSSRPRPSTSFRACGGFPFIHSYAGLRPKLTAPGGGSLMADFVIEESGRRPGWINLVGHRIARVDGGPGHRPPGRRDDRGAQGPAPEARFPAGPARPVPISRTWTTPSGRPRGGRSDMGRDGLPLRARDPGRGRGRASAIPSAPGRWTPSSGGRAAAWAAARADSAGPGSSRSCRTKECRRTESRKRGGESRLFFGRIKP